MILKLYSNITILFKKLRPIILILGFLINTLNAQDITIKSAFELEAPDPIIETIEVYVNGQLLTSGWSYDSANNWVRFDENNIPSGGQTIRIEYATYGCGEIEQ